MENTLRRYAKVPTRFSVILVLIVDVRAACKLHKFVEDTTLFERIPSTDSASNDVPSYFTSLLTWTANNDMQINTTQTKEIILGSLNSISLPPFSPLRVQLNASPHLNYLESTWTQICPGPCTLAALPQKLANGSISWNSLRERGFQKTRFSISIPQ